MTKHRPVVVVAYDSGWPRAFEEEARLLAAIVAPCAGRLHHIGSTSIPGMHAKPILDLLLEVRAVEALDLATARFAELGYEAKGEYGIAGRRFFRKHDATGVRTHHLHAFDRDSAHARRHLAFRDYMIAHPDEARRYGALKQRLALAHPDDIEAYMDGKAPYIAEHQAKSLAWYAAHAAAKT